MPLVAVSDKGVHWWQSTIITHIRCINVEQID